MTLPLGGFAIPHFAFHPIYEDLSMGTPGCEVWGTRRVRDMQVPPLASFGRDDKG